MKKVLYVATLLSHICQFHLPYLKLFKEQGYEVHVAARDNLAEKNGLQLKYTDKHFEVPFRRSPFNVKNIAAYKELKSVLKNEQYDLIVCNTPVGGIITRLVAQKYRKKGTKVIYIAHGFHFYKGASKKNWLLYYPIEKHFAKKCDVLVTINQEDYLIAKEKFKTRVEHIHGIGVDAKRYFPIRTSEKGKRKIELGYDPNEFVVLVVGELLTNKNQIQAIKAVEELVNKGKRIKLLIAGNGKTRQDLERYVDERGLKENINFLGYCTHLEDYQSCVDLGVSCSIREGLGLNVIEAMMSGNTFVATKNRGHNELIVDGENGFLVDVGDEQSLSERILFLMENNNERERMEKEALKRSALYALDNVEKEMWEIITSTLELGH